MNIYRYIFRRKKKKFCYHIVTPHGTACRMQNSPSYRKLDTYSDEPPPNRKLCAICAQAEGLPPPMRRACEAFLPPYPPLAPWKHEIQKLSKGPHDGLLASFGVLICKKAPDYRAESVKVCQQQYVRLFGAEKEDMTYEAARSALGIIKANGSPPPPFGCKPIPAPKMARLERIPKKKRKSGFNSGQSAKQLPADRAAFIVSNAFLESYEWRKVRYYALKQNNGCCEVCGRSKQHGIVLNVDHIKSRRERPDLALDVKNLQVLCHDCNHGKGNWDQTDWRKPSQSPEEREMERAAWERFEAF